MHEKSTNWNVEQIENRPGLAVCSLRCLSSVLSLSDDGQCVCECSLSVIVGRTRLRGRSCGRGSSGGGEMHVVPVGNRRARSRCLGKELIVLVMIGVVVVVVPRVFVVVVGLIVRI